MFNWFKKKSPPPGPDFSTIDSQSKAQKLHRQGQLEKLFLMPPEFGGQEIPGNTLFVPIGVADIKAGIDNNIIAPLVAEGKITSYTALPEYQGDSFIPIAIRIEASEPGHFTTTINIWGDALTRRDSKGADAKD
ncbi:hypothetical protein [Rubinisphaera margarita]|uniref:hypothetical protein n=1 Tax=Rubinisphaera margarita TaxID=2909586 RepID=UPI001EE8A31E|nr:hypothetical protein [Rubinisphaera margarita]MCG6155823.1 hypothetical protein [Rubinisphaera margarita]